MNNNIYYEEYTKPFAKKNEKFKRSTLLNTIKKKVP